MKKLLSGLLRKQGSYKRVQEVFIPTNNNERKVKEGKKDEEEEKCVSPSPSKVDPQKKMTKKEFAMAAFSQLSGSQLEFNPFSSNLNEHLVFSNEGKGAMNTQELREELAEKINTQLVQQIFGDQLPKKHEE
mmetsp:Transcript_10859/g.8067  ORF Transcript_10859/g.8067 Transcript_10859/m.8067 type:complete len:132 (-) Transcript_10859:240-635(-)